VMALAYILVISVGLLALMRRLLPDNLRFLISGREFSAAIFLPAIASAAPNYLSFNIAIIGFAAFVPATAQQRLRLFVFSLPLLPPMSSILTAPPPINQLTAMDYNTLFALGCVGLLFSVKSTGSRLGQWDFLMLLLACALLLGLAKGTSATNFLRVTLQIALLVGLPYLLLSRGAAVQAPARLILPLLFAATIVAAVTVFEWQRHWLLYDALENRYGLGTTLSSYVRERGGYLRAKATFLDSTSLSLFLAIATISLFAMRDVFKRRSLFYMMAAILIAGQLFTFARIGLVATLAGAVGLLFYQRRFGLLATAAVAAPLAWGALSLVAHYSSTLSAALGLSADAAFSVDYRSQLATRMIHEISQNPLLGLTQAEIRVRLADMRQGEGIIDLVNTPLAVALQSGLIGFLMFFAASAVALVRLLRLRRSGDPERTLAAGAIFSALLALHVGLLTTSLLARNQLWMVLLLALSAGVCATRRVATPRPAASNPQETAEPVLGSLA